MAKQPRISPRLRRVMAQIEREVNAMRIDVPETDEHRAVKARAEARMAIHDARIEAKIKMLADTNGGA